jgi:hypothetical protein
VLFVSYRRADEPYAVGLIAASLLSHFGRERVFLDTIANRRNRRIDSTLRRALETADGLLCVIGPRWDDASNLARLHEESDWVRLEIRMAIARKVPITVVLVERRSLPQAPDLPDELSKLIEAPSFMLCRSDFASVPGLLVHLGRAVPGLADDVQGEPDIALDPQTVRGGIDAMLRHTLPLPQQAMGNLPLLVNAVSTLLRPGEWLLDLTAGHLPKRPSGSAILVLTDRRLIVADLDPKIKPNPLFNVPLNQDLSVELIPRRRLWRRTADLRVHSRGEDAFLVRGLFREPAERLQRAVHDKLMSCRSDMT